MKTTKKWLSILTAFGLALGLAACGNGGNASTEAATDAGADTTAAETAAEESTEAASESTSAGDKTIGFVISTQTNPFFVSMKEGAEAKAKDLGVNLIVLDAQDDAAQATAGMEDLITKKVDLIIVNPTDSDAIGNAVIEANDAQIPVITVDRASNAGDVLTHIASDNVAGGKMAGDLIIEKLGGKGKVVELEGVPGANSAIERGQGFNDAIATSDIEVVAKQTANFDRTEGLNVMENILQAQPEIDAVFAHNDEMALGALEAIEGSGREILVVGFDATDDAVKAVEDGRMTATVAQQPQLMGEMAIEYALKAINGETLEKSIPVDLQLVTK
ncbi:MAG: ribose ABC transporter substrate-binding protein RbsB [Peptoniphilaceae bacterium]|nr:ribose ABC transporter substrate-binding protein RbsB [Peptoniphilaceae bacterium]MDY6086209.1 ribose ABC transporter substrate-binding protein RbsB [Peptoniphilaceae bacterium]